MNVLLMSAALVLLVWSPLHAITTDTFTVLPAGTGNRTGAAINVKGYTTAMFHVSASGGAMNAVVTFLATIDGSDFQKIACVPKASPTHYVASTGESGLFRCDIVGINKQIRADISGWVSGTITVVVGLSAAGVN